MNNSREHYWGEKERARYNSKIEAPHLANTSPHHLNVYIFCRFRTSANGAYKGDLQLQHLQ